MKKSLQNQLLGCACAALFLLLAGSIGWSQKQPYGFETPEEAAKKFAQAVHYGELHAHTRDRQAISSADWDKLDSDGVARILEKLQEQSKRPQFVTTKPKKTAKDTVEIGVAVAPPPSLPVVIVKSGNLYTVDLLATFAKRNNLRAEDGSLQGAVFKETSIVLPGLRNADSPHVKNRVCRRNLQLLSLAIAQYVQDYDERYPRAQNWQENLQPYTKSREVFRCPELRQGESGYALNANLVEKTLHEVERPGLSMVLFYETKDTRPSVVGRGDDMAYRHDAPRFVGDGLSQNFIFTNGIPSVWRPDFKNKPQFDAPAQAR